MDLTKIKMSPWSQVNIEVESQPGQKYPTTMMGYFPKRTVIITTPMLSADRPLLLRKDQSVIVRFFANKIAGAFQSKVLHVCTTPFHYFHLTYPANVETGSIRKAERVQCNIHVSVINKSQSQVAATPGALVDISAVGARLESRKPLGEAGDKIVVSAKIQIGRLTRVVTWDAEIKVSLDKFIMKDAVASYGIEFGHLRDMDYLALIAFVNTHIARGIGEQNG